ncbi:hypothetical protein EYF80_018945 [Liparis tanakae]|uniref:Uncharacterized protein n=1 Tax=Liparis tanakae TaxID=230148 RepID=A0A4Z2HZ15_9TELE|nr:hypothetical protein EYF80_018945 [Liparis tanakae]
MRNDPFLLLETNGPPPQNKAQSSPVTEERRRRVHRTTTGPERRMTSPLLNKHQGEGRAEQRRTHSGTHPAAEPVLPERSGATISALQRDFTGDIILSLRMSLCTLEPTSNRLHRGGKGNRSCGANGEDEQQPA